MYSLRQAGQVLAVDSSGGFHYHSQPHSHRTESLKLRLTSRRLQTAHALIHITHLTAYARTTDYL